MVLLLSISTIGYRYYPFRLEKAGEGERLEYILDRISDKIFRDYYNDRVYIDVYADDEYKGSYTRYYDDRHDEFEES